MSDLRQDHATAWCFAILILAVIGVTVICFSYGISGNDFWWHVKVGEYVVQNRTVPTADIFSWIGIEKGISWTAHEWLADVVFYGLYHAAGETGVFLFSLLFALLLSGLLLWEAGASVRKNIPVGSLFFVLFSVLTSLFVYGRPHVFSLLFVFCVLKLLYEFSVSSASKRIYLIPLITVLWSNLHGGSSNLAYLLCILFFVIGCAGIRFGRIRGGKMEKSARVRLGVVTLLTVGAVFVNPIGVRVFVYPYQSFADAVSMSVISEWQAPDAKAIGELILYYLPIAFVTVCLLSQEGTLRALDVGVMALFLFLFFRSARFIIFWYLAAGFSGLRYFPACKLKPIQNKWEKAAVGACALLLLGTVGYGITQTVKTAQGGELIHKTMSDEAVRVIKQDAPERLFNDYNLGEALIFHEIPVYFDARADLFAQAHIMEDGVSLMYLEQFRKDRNSEPVDVRGFLEDNDIDAVVILKTRPLYAYMVSHPELFSPVYEDASLAYYHVH